MPAETTRMVNCPRCKVPKPEDEGCKHCGLKPPYSKDRSKQLCYKCNRYCSRTCRFCPHCDK